MSTSVVSWCRDYLSHRQQCVKIEEARSSYKTISYGVPQGSILGPLFFIMYVNDLMRLFDDDIVHIIMYADDTVIYYADSDISTACSRVEQSLSKLHKWCAANKLTINVKKTQHMLVTPNRAMCQNVPYQVKMGDSTLQNVNTYNYLGVIIDNELLLTEFLKQKCNKINQRLYQFAKMRKFLTSHLANTLYKQVILPLFDYADFLIDGGPMYYIRKIDNLHEKAVKIIDCNKHRIDDLNVLENVYFLERPERWRKEHHCMIKYRLSKFGENIDTYRPTIRLRSRKKVKFKSNKRNLEKILKSPLYRGIKLWDMIPESIQRSLTKVKFKRLIKGLHL